MRVLRGLILAAGLSAAGFASNALAQTNDNIAKVAFNIADMSSMDPHRNGTRWLADWMFNALVRFPPGSSDPAKIEPDLAESWTVSPDGKEWTFKLRKGVKFHGEWGELTADDVVYSLNRARDPKRSSYAGSYSAITDVIAEDPYTVKVKLEYPLAVFMGLISNYQAGHIISKKAAEEKGDKFSNSPVGTGPFSFTEHVTQQHVKLTAHKNYFRGEPKLDGIMFRFIPSDSSRELAFNSGELDVIYGKREQRWVDAMRKRGDGVIDVFWPAEFRTLHLNPNIKPLDDRRVREAIASAINVDDIVRYVGADVGPKGCSVIPTGYLGEVCSWNYKYDPARAKTLLKEAGYENGVTIPVLISNSVSFQPILEIIQAQLGEVGIKIDLQVVDHATYHERIRKDASGLVLYGSARFPIADAYLTEFYHSDAEIGKPTAITNFSHCKVADKDIEAARRSTDKAEQLKYWADAQAKIHEQICAVPLFNLKQVWQRKKGLDYGVEFTGAMNLTPPINEKTTITR